MIVVKQTFSAFMVLKLGLTSLDSTPESCQKESDTIFNKLQQLINIIILFNIKSVISLKSVGIVFTVSL